MSGVINIRGITILYVGDHSMAETHFFSAKESTRKIFDPWNFIGSQFVYNCPIPQFAEIDKNVLMQFTPNNLFTTNYLNK